MTTQGEKAGDFARYLSFHLDLNIFGPSGGVHTVQAADKTSLDSQDVLPKKPRRTDANAAERAIRSEDIDAAARPPSREAKSAGTRSSVAPHTTHGPDGHRHSHAESRGASKPFR
jgi:hypothetical protein